MIEMLLNSGGSSALTQLSSKFGLSEDQARQAVEALAPALSIGLKRNTASPMGAGSFVEALASGRHGQYADNPELATSDEGIAEGNKILGHLLGSRDVSRAVTEQASQATGIGQSALKQMLPMLASMAMGAMSRGATQGSAGGSGGILGQIMGSLLGGGATRSSAPQRRPSGGDNPLGRIFEDMLGGKGQATKSSPPQQRNTDEGGLGQVFEDLLGQGTRSSRNTPKPAGDDFLGGMLDKFLDGDDEKPQVEVGGQRRRAPSSGNLGEVFGDLFESGKSSNDSYQNGLEGIFDKFVNKR
jgi:hypothetical protein